MRESESSRSSWQTPLIIAFGIILVILAALFLAQIDNVQRRSLLPPKRLPLIDLEATVISGDLGVVYLPGEVKLTPTATATPITLTPTNGEKHPPTAVAVIVPTCHAKRDGWTGYIVKPGDSLSSLAIHSGISKNAIVQANCLEHERIIHGQLIFLPQNVPTNMKINKCGVPQNWIHYLVHPGDTLQKLADERKTTVPLIMKANCLENKDIAAGRKLFLPPS